MNYLQTTLTLFLNLILIIGYSQISNTDFVTTWGFSNDSVIHIPVDTNFSYNYDIDWDNDGVFDDLGVTDSISHKYNHSGLTGPTYMGYRIRIRGSFPSFKFQKIFQKTGIIEVNQWGNILIKDFSNAFKNLLFLDIKALDAPKFDTTINISCESMFYGTTGLVANFNHWDMSKVTNMKGMFEWSAGYYTGAIDFSSWDVSNVTTMENMFKSCANLQEDFSNWDVSSVKNMSGMFHNADYVIGDVSNWNVSSVKNMSYTFAGVGQFTPKLLNVSSWTVDSVTDMSFMFNSIYDTISSLKTWNVSSVTNMESMFAFARNFNQNLGVWDVSSVVNMNNMLNSFNNWGSSPAALSTPNYDSTLMGWANQTHQLNVSLGALNVEYCNSINERDSLLADGWNINGDTTFCSTTSIKENKSDKYSFYPNPTNGIVKVEGLSNNVEIAIYSIQGKFIQVLEHDSEVINIEGLPNGIYYLKFDKGTIKIVKQ